MVETLPRRLEALLGTPATSGNDLAVLRNGDAIFPAMLDALGSAQRTIDMLTYVYWTGWPAQAFAEALSDRARAGVRVRLLIDAVGGARMDAGLIDKMRDSGVRVERFRPPWLRSPLTHNHRTHRKVLVVDGLVGFTGGVGIAEEWQGDARGPDEWRDTHLRVVGPAVDGLRAAFVQNWAETTGEVEVVGDDYPMHDAGGSHTVLVVRGTAALGWDDIETAWHLLITAANESLRLQTAYFAPDDDFLGLLNEAAGRGVKVEVLLPGPHCDKAVSRLASQRHFQSMLDAGVNLWRYQPTMLHTKVLVVDGRAAMIGSSNFNRRSLDHDEEVACIILDGDAPQVLAEQFDADLEQSNPVEGRAWRRRPPLERLGEQAVRPLSRYL